MRRLVCGLAIVVASGCSGNSGNSSNSSPAAPAAPTIAASNETFSGTVNVSGNDFHPFTVGTAGATLNVTLTAAGPPSTIFMGLGLGAYNAPTARCSQTRI